MAQSIAITTPQNVVIDYTLANLGDRILAYILDSLIKVGYALLIFLLLLPQADNVNMTLISVIGFFLFLPVILYSLLFEVFNNGQTPGKLVMSIRVIHLEGQEVSFSSYFLRWLFRIVDILMMSGIIGVLTIAFSEKGQRVGDIIANTSVISLKKKSDVQSSAFQKVKEDYIPLYPAVANLKTSDIVTIKEVLKIRGEDAFQLTLKLSEKLENVLGVRKEGSSTEFLQQIINDFNYYQQLED